MSDSDETMDMDSESLFFRIRNLWAGASDKMNGAGEFVHDMVEKPVQSSEPLRALRRCVECGSAMADDDAYCPKCGAFAL